MANKNEKWVEKFNRYKKMDLETIVAKKEEKGEDATKFKDIKENMPKVENMKNYLDKMKAEKEKLEGQKQLVNAIKSAPDKIKQMEEKMAEIEVQNKKLEKEMADIEKQVKANPAQKIDLDAEYKKLMKEYGNNQAKYAIYEQTYFAKRKLLEKHSGEKFVSSEECEKRLSELDKTIEQCNFICSELMEGKKISEVMPELYEKEHNKVEEQTVITEPEDIKKENDTVTLESQNIVSAKESVSKKSFKDRFLDFLSKHPKIASVVNKLSRNKFVPELREAEEVIIEEPEENSFRDELKVVEEKQNDDKEKDGIEMLQYQLLETIAEHGENSDKAKKIASQIKLQKYIKERTGVSMGSKIDIARYNTEKFEPVSKVSGMRDALKVQDKIANGGVKPRDKHDDGR